MTVNELYEKVKEAKEKGFGNFEVCMNHISNDTESMWFSFVQSIDVNEKTEDFNLNGYN